eukprot:1894386-Prymnesium_polylepis.1
MLVAPTVVCLPVVPRPLTFQPRSTPRSRRATTSAAARDAAEARRQRRRATRDSAQRRRCCVRSTAPSRKGSPSDPDGQVNHTTGLGWVVAHTGYYSDAIKNKKKRLRRTYRRDLRRRHNDGHSGPAVPRQALVRRHHSQRRILDARLLRPPRGRHLARHRDG